MSDDEIELLTSPIERRAVSRLFVIGGPLGLAIAIIVSLWVSHLRISDSVIVQTEPQWIPGESLALRVQLTPEGPDPAPQAVVTLEAFPDAPVGGEVAKVADLAVAKGEDGIKVLEVEVSLDETREEMKPGLSAVGS